jgi:phospholipase C
MHHSPLFGNRPLGLILVHLAGLFLIAATSGCGGVASSSTGAAPPGTTAAAPTVTIAANPAAIAAGQSSSLSVTAQNASKVTITDNLDGNTFTLPASGGTQTVSPTATITYTATASGSNGQTAHASATVTVTTGTAGSIEHVIFMLQENRTFDTYFGMLNPYRIANRFNIGDDGKEYDVDGIDDKLTKFSNKDDEGDTFTPFKLTSTCIDDDSSAWLESYGSVNRFDFLANRPILMDGFVHVAEGFAKSGAGSGSFTDLQGKRAMGFYDQQFLNYYYFMASQFALSDRWFSPVASKSTPNRIATMSGGTTQGLVRDPQQDDKFGALAITPIFQELDGASVSWKIYYTVTDDNCLAGVNCNPSAPNKFPSTTFAGFSYAQKYLSNNPNHAVCTPPKQSSLQAVGDPANAFCIDPAHIAPISQFFTDLGNNKLPSFAYIEAGFGVNDEHPGSGQSILNGQAQVASLLNAFMASSSWQNSVYFFSYDEGGGPFDHVPPVPGHTNDNTDAALGVTTDISGIAVNPDGFLPCVAPSGGPSLHCDVSSNEPGANPGDAAAQQGFAAQLGFRLPNMIVSPFARRHFVSHTPMDHTAIIKFVESHFIGPNAHLTNRDMAQPDLLEFFDFINVPWKTPPTPPTPVAAPGPCNPQNFGP